MKTISRRVLEIESVTAFFLFFLFLFFQTVIPGKGGSVVGLVAVSGFDCTLSRFVWTLTWVRQVGWCLMLSLG